MPNDFAIFDLVDNKISRGLLNEALDLMEPYRNDSTKDTYFWALYKSSLIYNQTENFDKFMELSETCCFVLETSDISFRTAKLQLHELRINFLMTQVKNFKEDLDRWLSLKPSGHNFEELIRIGAIKRPDTQEFLEPDKTIICPIKKNNDDRGRICRISNPHHAISTEVPELNVVPQISIFENADYFTNGREFLIHKNGKYVSCSPVSLHLIDQFNRYREINVGAIQLKGTAISVSDIFSLPNYCHWTLDWAPRLFLCAKYYKKPDWVCMTMEQASYHEQFFEMTDTVKPWRWITNMGVRWLKFDEVVMVSNDTISQTHPAFQGSRDILNLIRDAGDDIAQRYFSTYPKQNINKSSRIYVDRSDVGGREILNNDEFLAVMKEYQIDSVSLTGMPLGVQLNLFKQCQFVIGVHGAGLTNIAYMGKGAVVLEILNSQFGSRAYSVLASRSGLDYYYMSCPTTAHGEIWSGDRPLQHQLLADSAIWVDVEVLRRALNGIFLEHEKN